MIFFASEGRNIKREREKEKVDDQLAGRGEICMVVSGGKAESTLDWCEPPERIAHVTIRRTVRQTGSLKKRS